MAYSKHCPEISLGLREITNSFSCIQALNWTHYLRNTIRKLHWYTELLGYIVYDYLYIETFCQQKINDGTLLLGSILLKRGRRFEYWNQPLNTRMRVCCLDCHEAGLCCYLVIHIENLLRPLQLFHFHLCPIYWLPLEILDCHTCIFLVQFIENQGRYMANVSTSRLFIISKI
jgi:hypothetical protein